MESKNISNELQNPFRMSHKISAIEDLIDSKGLISQYDLHTYFKMHIQVAGTRQIKNMPLHELIHTNVLFIEILVRLLLQKNIFTKEEFDETLGKQVFMGAEVSAIDLVQTDTVRLEVLNRCFKSEGLISEQEFRDEGNVIISSDKTGRWNKRTS